MGKQAKDGTWAVPAAPGGARAEYTDEQRARISLLEADLAVQLVTIPKRLKHSLSVAATAEAMALLYDVDPYLARAAGILHDWDKVVPHAELVRRAEALGIQMGVPLTRVEPLLHGIVAARELPARYPWLPDEVWHAIAVHTTAAAQMSPLDMVIFVADGVEPRRPDTPGIRATRDLVGKVSLEDLFWESFVGGLTYVLEGGRYLYPGTLDVYNSLAADRAAKAGRRF